MLSRAAAHVVYMGAAILLFFVIFKPARLKKTLYIGPVFLGGQYFFCNICSKGRVRERESVCKDYNFMKIELAQVERVSLVSSTHAGHQPGQLFVYFF